MKNCGRYHILFQSEYYQSQNIEQKRFTCIHTQVKTLKSIWKNIVVIPVG